MRKAIAKITTWIILFTICLSIVKPFISQAAEKQTTVTIENEAKDIVFKIVFEKSGTYDAVLISPEGEEYLYTVVDNTTMTCELDKAKVGDWTTKINSSGDVGKYTISVNGKKDTATTNVSGNISVGKDIVGLRIYFKDNNIVTEWTDTTIGNVVVKVVNLDNSEVLGNETVNGTSYECEIPETVRNISVSVVPSTSRNVDGAEQTFTFSVPERPNPSITYSAKTVTNNPVLNVSVDIDESYAFLIQDNEKNVYESDLNTPGHYDLSIELAEEGANKVKFYIIDENGNMFSYDSVIALDTVAPQLSLDRDYDHAIVTAATVTIGGKVEDYHSLTINDEKIEPASDGVFEADLKLHLGDNKVVISAVDKAGNETKYDLVVVREEKKSIPPYIIGLILSGITLVIGIIVFLVKKMLNKNKKDIENKTPNIVQNKQEYVVEEEVEIEEEISEKSQAYNTVWYWILCHKNKMINWGLFFAMIIFVFGFAININYVSSGSMEPTLMTGDIQISNQMAYITRSPQRGDIISFYSKELKETMGKRVIGVAGDKIEFYDGYVYVNGKQLDESAYLDEDVETNCMKSFDVPKGCVFVLGDNRENSKDSRFFENPYIKVSDIRDKHMFCIPLSKL